MTIVRLDDNDKRFLNTMHIGPGDYSAEDNQVSFMFPSDKNDFTLRIFEEGGEMYAEFPDAIEPAYEGKTLDLMAREDYKKELAGKIVAIYC